MALDYFGDLDSRYTQIPNPLYFYFIPGSKFSEGTEVAQYDKITVPPINVVQSLFVSPYYEESDFTLRVVDFDIDRFPADGNVKMPSGSTFNRIDNHDLTKVRKSVGTFQCYKPSKNIGGYRSWKNESKLYQYPFMHGVLDDGIMKPYEFKYHLCKDLESNIRVTSPLTNYSTYSVEIQNYKGDTDNRLEVNISNSSNDFPTVSSAYSQYMAMNKAQFNAKKTSTLINSAVALGGLAAAPFTGGFSLGATAVAGANIFNNINSLKASERDLLDQPNQITDSGNADIMYKMKRPVSQGLYHYRLQLKEEEMQKIGDFFAMFGYKQNKIMSPNTRSRHYYNYIKTIGINISSNGIPKDHLNKLKNIYDSGVTIWHIDRNGVNVGDYSRDNMEV